LIGRYKIRWGDESTEGEILIEENIIFGFPRGLFPEGARGRDDD
jgi:hypothetical protein